MLICHFLAHLFDNGTHPQITLVHNTYSRCTKESTLFGFCSFKRVFYRPALCAPYPGGKKRLMYVVTITKAAATYTHTHTHFPVHIGWHTKSWLTHTDAFLTLLTTGKPTLSTFDQLKCQYVKNAKFAKGLTVFVTQSIESQP